MPDQTTTTAIQPIVSATASGPDMPVGGEAFPRRVRSDSPFGLVVPVIEGDAIEITVSASADPRVRVPIALDVWTLDAKGRDRRALSGALSPAGIRGWTVGADPVHLVHTFDVRASDLVDGAVHLVLVAGCQQMLRNLHIASAPLAWSARVLREETP